jgi:hypothetical protein
MIYRQIPLETSMEGNDLPVQLVFHQTGHLITRVRFVMYSGTKIKYFFIQSEENINFLRFVEKQTRQPQ